MKKTLYIVRHAKSSWNFDLPDEDRPLGLRGRLDVVKVGKHLAINENTPDVMISSPASRALYTALFIADEWGYPEAEIHLEKRLYHASAEQILTVISEQKTADSIVIFGHNPGFTELVNFFSEDYLDNLSTCGVFAFTFEMESWSNIGKATPTLKMKIKPKRLKA